MDKDSVIVKCTDNCSCMSIDKFNDEPYYYVTYYSSYGGTSLWYRIKSAWKVLKGGSVVNNELVLEPEDFQKILDFNKKVI